MALSLFVVPFNLGSNPAFASPDDGSCDLLGYGTQEYPYLVDSLADLEELEDCDDVGQYFRQIADIDLANRYPNISNLEGHYDGFNFTISNLLFNDNTTNDVGLFSRLDDGSSVRNLTLDSFAATGADRVGALAGFALRSTIDNIRVIDAQISGADVVGILTGSSNANISNVLITGSTATAAGHVGALSGSISLSVENGATAEDPTETNLTNISINATVVKSAGNSNTGAGSLSGNLTSRQASALTIENLATVVSIQDAGTNSFVGTLFGSNFDLQTDQVPITLSNSVIDVDHSLANGGTTFFGVFAGSLKVTDLAVSNSVVDISALQLDASSPPVASARNFGFGNFNGSTFESEDFYVKQNANYLDAWSAGIEKSVAELQNIALYGDWSITSDPGNAYGHNPTTTWYLGASSYPKLTSAIRAGYAGVQDLAYVPSVIGHAGQLAQAELFSNTVSTAITATVSATLVSDSSQLNIVNADAGSSYVDADSLTTSAVFAGVLSAVNADIRNVVIDAPLGSVVDVSITVKRNDTDVQLFSTTHRATIATCTLQGNGTADSPYLIQSQQDLDLVLTCDADEVVFQQTSNIAMTYAHAPIGNDWQDFVGVYDGNDYEITNFVNNNPYGINQAFIGVAGDGEGVVTSTEIRDLTLRGSVRGGNYTALLVGDVDDLKVSGLRLYGSVIGDERVSLLAGDAEDLKASDVVADGWLVGEQEVGMIIGDGFAQFFTIEDISIRGMVLGEHEVGGFAGRLGNENEQRSALVRGVSASVDVISTTSQSTGNSEDIGGLVGRSFSVTYIDITIRGLPVPGTQRVGSVFSHDDPLFTGSRQDIGGLAGYSFDDVWRDIDVAIDVILDNPGASTDDQEIGGLIGDAEQVELGRALYTGTVIGWDEVGGVIGALDASADSSRSYVFQVEAAVEVIGNDELTGGFASNVNAADGANDFLLIEHVSISGSVENLASGTAGGFIGAIDPLEYGGASHSWLGEINIRNSRTNVTVKVTDDRTAVGIGRAGGFIGRLKPNAIVRIDDSSATGPSVEGFDEVGGFIGSIYSGQKRRIRPYRRSKTISL